MSDIARVTAAQLTHQAEAGVAPGRPRISLGQIFAGTGREIVEVPVELVHRDETQAREDFDKTKLEELAASIRQEGIIEPLELRPHPDQEGHYVIIWGERRWRAAQLAELARIINREPKHVRRRQLYENVMREDLNGVELARIVVQTMEEDGLDSKGMADQLNWPLRKVQRLVEIHEAPAVVKAAMVKGVEVEGGCRVLSSRHALDVVRAYRHLVRDDKSEGKAKALARLEKLIAKVLAEDWTTRKLQTYVTDLGRRDAAEAAPRATPVPASTAADAPVHAGAAIEEGSLYELTETRFAIDLGRLRSNGLTPDLREEVVGHLRRLLLECEAAGVALRPDKPESAFTDSRRPR